MGWGAVGHWRKLAPVPILALVTEYQGVLDEQVVVLFQILAAEINFGYRFQTVRCESLNGQGVCNLRSLATLVDRCQCAPVSEHLPASCLWCLCEPLPACLLLVVSVVGCCIACSGRVCAGAEWGLQGCACSAISYHDEADMQAVACHCH